MRFTQAAVEALTLPPGKNDHIEWDPSLPGFGLRIRATSKNWRIQYRIAGRQRSESLGDVRRVKLDDARRIARQRFASVELGVDPSAERAKAKAEATALVFGSVAGRYLAAKRHRMTERTHPAATRYFATCWNTFDHRPLDTIRRADIAARLQELIEEHGRAAATRARSNLSAMFAWAMGEGLCEANPVVATNNPGAGVQARDRILTDGELAAIWAACLDDDFGRILKLLILLGCRRDEIGVMSWNEVDLDAGVLTIPGARTKSKRSLRLPLPAMALALLHAQPRRDGREYVFGPRGIGFSGWSFATVALHKRLAAAKLAPWRIHDLRRTMRSGLGRLGVPPHVAELAIGHARRGIEGTYDRYSYQVEIGQALARWGDYVIAAVEGRAGKIVPLRA